jgi:flavodoxin
MKALVVYYSRTGNTRMIAAQVASTLGAEVEAIGDHGRRAGLLGWLRCAFEGRLGRLVRIDPPAFDPAAFDLVVVGGPIWASSVSSPVRSYLRRHRGALPAVAFFCTCGGRGDERVFAQMAEACGEPPVATLVVRESELTRAAAAVARFTSELALSARSAPDSVHAAPSSPPPSPGGTGAPHDGHGSRRR